MDTEGGGAGRGPGRERRRARRVRAELSCNWGWDAEVKKQGRVSSIGAGGCFVVTRAQGERGTVVHVHLWLPGREWLKLRGRVLYSMGGVGVGVTFEELGDEERGGLERLIDHLEANPPRPGR